MYYVLIIAPMDQVFVGPIPDESAAQRFAAGMYSRTGHDCYVYTAAQFIESIAKHGPLPVQGIN